MRGDLPYMGRLPNFGKGSHTWEDFPCMGRLSTCGKTSHTWGVSPYMGSLSVSSQDGKSSKLWEVFLYLGLVIRATSQDALRFALGSADTDSADAEATQDSDDMDVAAWCQQPWKRLPPHTMSHMLHKTISTYSSFL